MDSRSFRNQGLHPERRRSERRTALVPLFAYGHPPDQEPFHELVYSKTVNDRGALLVMTTVVPAGCSLVLVNQATGLEQQCRVVRVGDKEGLSVEVAVELSVPSWQFWRLIQPSQLDTTTAINETAVRSYRRST
jgi:hypothetical protein